MKKAHIWMKETHTHCIGTIQIGIKSNKGFKETNTDTVDSVMWKLSKLISSSGAT